MLGKLNQVAIAVPDVEKAAALYRDTLGVEVSEPKDMPEHGVRIVFAKFPNTCIELIEPLGENSPIAGFLERNPQGGIHHIGFDVNDIEAVAGQIREKGVRVLGDGKPKIGGHGNPVLFLHPKDLNGALIELEEVKD